MSTGEEKGILPLYMQKDINVTVRTTVHIQTS